MSQATDKQNSPEHKGSNGFRVSRRAFIGISAGAAAVLTAVLAIKRPNLAEPVETQTTKAIATQEFVPTSCLNCPTRCAISVRRVETTAGETKVVKVAGNHNSTYSEGKCCSRSHVGLQVLYNPDRFQKPLVRVEGTEKGRGVDYAADFVEAEWSDVLPQIAQRLRSVPAASVLLLQGLNTTSNDDLIRQFALAYGTPNLFVEDSLETASDHEGKMLADGRSNSWYELQSENGTSTQYILAFGAGIVESERPLARNLNLWGKLRRGNSNKTKVVVFDSRYSVTASRADEWVSINPGTEGAMAMAIAHVIVKEGLYDLDFIDNHTDGFNKFRTVVMTQRFSPEAVSGIVGVDADTIIRIAREFAHSKPAIAWSGEPATSWPYGTFASHAIYCLNALVGSIDVPGGIIYQQYPDYAPMPTEGLPITDTGVSFRKMGELIRHGAVGTAIGFNSNLIMSVPESGEGDRWDEALKNLYYVHIGPAHSEMAAYADIILPACTYLEDWGYESAIPGSGYAEARIKQPVVDPLNESRPIARILFDLANLTPVAGPFSPVATNSEAFPVDFVSYRISALPDYAKSTMPPWPGLSLGDFQATGVWRGTGYTYRTYDFHTPSGKFEIHSDHFERLLNVKLPGEDTQYPLALTIYRPVLEIRSGSQNFPWAQEMYLVMSGIGWRNLIEINSETAHDFGISEGDEVIVESVFGEIEGEARVLHGIRPGVVAIATGQGHFASGEYADGMGVNPNDVIGTEYDEESGQPSFFATRIRVRKA